MGGRRRGHGQDVAATAHQRAKQGRILVRTERGGMGKTGSGVSGGRGRRQREIGLAAALARPAPWSREHRAVGLVFSPSYCVKSICFALVVVLPYKHMSNKLYFCSGCLPLPHTTQNELPKKHATTP
jgi:hypothetical protein